MADSQIRRATLADADAIARVHVQTWQTAYRGMMPDEVLAGLSLEGRAAGWREQLATPDDRHVFVATRQSAVVGFISCGPSRDADADETVAEIYAVYVQPELWGEGLGTQLIHRAIEALEEDYRSLDLWVLSGNERARQFYEDLDFATEGGSKVEHAGSAALREVRYRRPLSIHHPEVVRRPGAKLLLVDPADRVLLIACHPPRLNGGHFWFAPGGGIEPGEDATAAAVREAYEETGLALDDPGRPVFARRCCWSNAAGTTYESIEQFFFRRVAAFVPNLGQLQPLEAQVHGEYRWWSVDELAATDEVLVPRRLPQLLPLLLERPLPTQPLRIGR